MLVLNLPFKALMFLTLMRPSLVLFLVLWLKLVKDFLKVRCRLALLPFLISCLIWLDLVASLPLIKERILVIILLLQDRKSGSAGMPRPISYAVFCLKKKKASGTTFRWSNATARTWTFRILSRAAVAARSRSASR